MSQEIRILLADDHDVVRRGLTALLDGAEGFAVVGAAADGEEAVALAGEHEPDVVLMDLSMPGVDGIEATRRLMAARPDSRVVVLTSFSDRERILLALDAGAVGYLLKDAEPDELLRGIEAAARGESPLAPKAAKAVLTARAESRPAAELTAREQEVLGLLAEGLANKQIARRLGIAEKTVKAHLTSVFQSIGVTDRTQAALWARSHDIGGSSGS
ncbi:MAG TPA: response regulator transcription factor [Acidimicrobiales bacterium]|nr:response regulator transcription factor [Acidimicrobiales bacterium]